MGRNSTRKALQLLEICDSIASCAEDATTVSLLYVCRLFFQSAVGYVWSRRLVAAESLLVLLDGFTYPVHGRNKYIQVNIPRPLPKAYFDRLNLYAPHVRKLILQAPTRLEDVDTTLVNYDELQYLSDLVNSASLCPRLLRLTLSGLDDTFGYSPLGLSLLKLFLSPTITEFCVEHMDCFNQFSSQSLFNCLKTQVFIACPKLQLLRLSRSSWHRPSDENEEIQPTTRRLGFRELPVAANLTDFTFTADLLCTELIIWMSKLPHLRVVTIKDLQQSDSIAFSQVNYIAGLFPSIHTLQLDGVELSAMLELWNTPIVSNLKQLTCHIEDDSLGQMQLLFERIITRSKKLNSFTILNCMHEDFKVKFDEIANKPHTKLVELIIDDRLARRDFLMRSIASVWPSLRRLLLESHTAKLEDFLQLPVNLPMLEYLEIMLPNELQDLSGITLHTANLPLISSAVSSLHLSTFIGNLVSNGQPNIQLVMVLAGFLRRWWPNIQLAYPSSTRHFGPWLDAGKKLNAYIRFLDQGDQSGGQGQAQPSD